MNEAEAERLHQAVTDAKVEIIQAARALDADRLIKAIDAFERAVCLEAGYVAAHVLVGRS